MPTKTREEVIKALGYCAKGTYTYCNDCPYYKVPDCHSISKYDAIYYISKYLNDGIGSEEECRLRQVIRSQQQTINALLVI